ncbi:MAG: MaoC family dehydratase, partial [Parahaliea sp.]
MEFVGRFSISQDFTREFAAASGDYNPLHVDPLVARRYQYGSTVIHGICGLLKALELLLASLQPGQALTQLQAQFRKPIRHGDTVEVHQSPPPR